MFVLPPHILRLELLCFGWRRRRLSNLGNEVGGRGFGDAIDEDAEKWDFEEDEEGNSEAVEDTLAVTEPEPFLFGAVADAREVGLEL